MANDRKLIGAFAPGDALPGSGDIIMSATTALRFGVVFVTKKQAKHAEQYGWLIQPGLPGDGDLVRIVREPHYRRLIEKASGKC